MGFGGEKSDWLQCEDKTTDAVASIGNSAWSVKNYPSGGVEQTISNDTGDQISFSCTNGRQGSILVMLSNQEFFGGLIDFIVDDKTHNLMTWSSSIEINSDCNACVSQYYAMMESLKTGRFMTVIPQGGQAASFDITGADEIFGGEICTPKGW